VGAVKWFIKFVMSMLIMWGQSNEDQESADHVHVDSSCIGTNLLEIEEMPAIDEIYSSNLLEIEEIKQRGTRGAWLRPWIQATTWHTGGQRLELRPWIQTGGELEGSSRRKKE
jgi:hypothetical protein